MNGFNDKALQAIWDGLRLPADIRKQEEFERLVYEWADNNERIIRCRDCRYNDPDSEDNWRNYENACSMFADYESTPASVEPDGFCAWGERRDDA